MWQQEKIKEESSPVADGEDEVEPMKAAAMVNVEDVVLPMKAIVAAMMSS